MCKGKNPPLSSTTACSVGEIICFTSAVVAWNSSERKSVAMRTLNSSTATFHEPTSAFIVQHSRRREGVRTKSPANAVPGPVAEGNETAPSVREFTRLRHAARDDPTFGLKDMCVFAPHFRVYVHSGKRNMEDLSTRRETIDD